MDAATPRDLDQLDSEALKALILALREQVFSHQKQLTTQQEEILSQREQLASRDAEIEHLKLLIARLRRLQFGRSSEKRERQIEQLNGIDPESYLRNVLSRIVDHPINRIEELLPWNVAASLSPEIDEAA